MKVSYTFSLGCATRMNTAWKVSVFGAFLVRIFPYLGWMQTRKIPNMNTFQAVEGLVVFNSVYNFTTSLPYIGLIAHVQLIIHQEK